GVHRDRARHRLPLSGRRAARLKAGPSRLGLRRRRVDMSSPFTLSTRSLGTLLILSAALSAALGWSLSALIWLAPVFAVLLAFAGWRVASGLSHAAEFAVELARSVEHVDQGGFQRPISDRAPKELDRLASALTE